MSEAHNPLETTTNSNYIDIHHTHPHYAVVDDVAVVDVDIVDLVFLERHAEQKGMNRKYQDHKTRLVIPTSRRISKMAVVDVEDWEDFVG